MLLAINGHQNKEIARLLGISHRTVELHRSRVMRKMGAATLLELASTATAAGLPVKPTALDPTPR
jgi:DNA-binding NarL/FixJ family response regulator